MHLKKKFNPHNAFLQHLNISLKSMTYIFVYAHFYIESTSYKK